MEKLFIGTLDNEEFFGIIPTMKLPLACSKYGAQMGRRNILPADTDAKIKLKMEKLKWVDGDYDMGGAYWGGGGGNNIYCAYAYINEPVDYDFGTLIFVRAYDRNEAKKLIREMLPQATFWR
jgi:hypothetical protein